MKQAGFLGKPVLEFVKILVMAYLLTIVLLMAVSAILLFLGGSERFAVLSAIGIYVSSTFFAGFLAGKRMKTRKYLWGLIMGMAYFVVLAIVSAFAKEASDTGNSFLTTLILCVGGGTLGGMVS